LAKGALTRSGRDKNTTLTGKQEMRGVDLFGISLKRLLLASCVMGLFPAGDALAQDASDDQSSTEVETVNVTAQRREESAQDVPLSVSVVTANTAEAMGVTDTASLEAAVPGLQFTRALNNATPALRGIGGDPAAPLGSESTVATYLDGVYVPSAAATLFSFNNIERIEVWRGPQGTLFGRNATGGVVQVITRNPSPNPSADLSVGYANYDTITGNFYGTAGLTPNLAADLALFYEDQQEGWGTNLTNGEDMFTSEQFGARTKWLLTPTDRTRITFAADHYHTEGNTGVAQNAFPGTVLADFTSGFAGFYNVYGNLDNTVETTQSGVSLHVDQDLDWARFVSITGYRDVTSEVVYDGDKIALPITDIYINSGDVTFTQELQLLSPSDSQLEWIAGLYYFNNEAQYEPITIAGFAVAPFAETTILNEQVTDSYAAYGQATANIAQDTRLTLGVRYTKDERSQSGSVAGDGFPLFASSDESSFSEWTYRVALDHRFSPGFLGYASYARGFQSGLYNLVSPGSPPVEPELLDAYEVGFKSDFLDNRLRLNVAAYHYQFDNLQVSLLQGTTTTLVNAAEAESQGIDIELQAVPFENLRLSGAVSYIDGTFTDYPDAMITTPNPGALPCPGPAPATPNCVSTGDATGNSVPRAPEWSGNLAAQYTIPTSTGDFLLALNYYYNGGYYWDADNRLEQPAYSLVNASVTWESSTSGLSFRVWGKNLLDEEYYVLAGASLVGDVGSPAPPLTFGATIGYRW
jgi:iron complex outermembrane receptor protein